MKNFRKVLALVLVVATLFSFTAMTSAAYEDADKISYEMAVDVLSAVGILNGYEVAEDEYEFKPTNAITREEMAKMIAVLANSGTDVSELYATACTFADVAKTRWSASYVAYCAKTGIVAGRSASTFDPTANVTGLETAKMLLVVLGFDANEQGYVGADWKVNVLRDAKVMGLLDGFAASYDIEANITREEAANMMLNALCAPAVVGILSNGIIDVTNALIVDWTGKTNIDKLMSITGYAMLKDAISAGKWCLYDNVVISNDILYKTLFPGLKIEAGVECFGRAASTFAYTVKGVVKASGNYATGAGKAYTTQVDLAADYKKELNAANPYEIVTTIDGVAQPTIDTAAEVKEWTGNGVDTVVTTKVDAAGNYYLDVNIINTYIGKVADYNKYTGKFSIIGEGTTITGVVADAAVKNGQYVLFRLCNAEKHAKVYGKAGSDALYTKYCVHDYEVVTPVAATVDYSRSYIAGHINKCYIKSAEGETYNYNANYGDISLGRDVALTAEPKAYETKNLYLDKYGYIMLMTGVAETKYVAYIEEGSDDPVVKDYSYASGAVATNWDIMLDAAIADGTEGAIELAEIKTEDAPKSGLLNFYDVVNGANYKTGALVQYTVDSKGYAEAVANGAYIKAGTKIAKTATTVASDIAGNNYTLNGDTIFIIRSFDAAANAWTYEEVVGVDKLAYTYYVETSKGGNGTTAQLLNTDTDMVAEYVFIDAQYVYGATEFIVLSDAHIYNASWTGAYFATDSYKGYRALVNGVEAIVCVDKDVTLQAGYLYDGALSFKDLVLDEDNGVALYHAAYKATKRVNAALEAVAESITISVGVNSGDVDVMYTDMAGKHQSWNAVDELPVYHLTAKATENSWSGYWVETNSMTDLGGIVRTFVVLDSNKVATAIYVVHSGAGY